jgi:hypothetical protein
MYEKTATDFPKILILTPVKDAAAFLPDYFKALNSLDYPFESISVGFLESDSRDETFEELERLLPVLRNQFRKVGLWRKNFGFLLPPDVERWDEKFQLPRRVTLAKSRNHLLFHALDDEDWVLWLDVDVVEYPPDIIKQLLETRKLLVQPHCVLEYGGRTFDRNGWREHGKYHLDSLRAEGDLVKLDAVGGTMLLVHADAHRDGLIFPAFPYGRENAKIRKEIWGGEVETEGLGIMALDMGIQPWGMPNLEIKHRNG